MLSGYLHLLRRERRLLLFGGAAAFFSSPGQTFMIGLFVGSFASELALSPATLGGLYSVATLAAAVFFLLGAHWIDRVDLRLFTAAAVLGLAGACLWTAGAVGPVSLFLGLVLLRLTGQGLLSHVEVTSIARFFGADRGKALALSASGFAVGEAVLPALTVAAILALGWRQSFVAVAIVLVVLGLPLLLWLVRSRPDFCRPTAAVAGAPSWGWLEGFGILARTRFFWMILPLLIAGPLVGTGLIFHIETVATANGWSLGAAARAFTGYALGNGVALFAAGPLIDRFGARRVLPLAALPLLVGIAASLASDHWAVLYVLLATMGMSAALTIAANGALWAEVYGTTHLGGIRGVAAMLTIVGTAMGPAILGAMIGRGQSLDTIMAASALATLAAMILAATAPARVPAVLNP